MTATPPQPGDTAMQMRSWAILTAGETLIERLTQPELLEHLLGLESYTGVRARFAKGNFAPVYKREDLVPLLDPAKVAAALEAPDPVCYPPQVEREKLRLGTDNRPSRKGNDPPVDIKDILVFNETCRAEEGGADKRGRDRRESSAADKIWERKGSPIGVFKTFLKCALFYAGIWYILCLLTTWLIADIGFVDNALLSFFNVHLNMIGNPLTAVPFFSGAIISFAASFYITYVMRFR